MNFRVIRNQARSLLFKEPLYCRFRITDRCNFRCPMCKAWKRGSKDNELDLDKIRLLANILKKSNLSLVNIGGGSR